MLAIDVQLLTGRYVATRFNDRNRVEWPPHPARLFSAAVAAWADAEVPDPVEREALLWWETLGAPEIECSWGEAWSERAPVIHYVPDNDTQVIDRTDTYARLRAAIDAAAIDDPDPKTKARHSKQLVKAQAKATDDSRRVASKGSAPLGALAVLPDLRGGQARVYPTAVPEVDKVTYAWPDANGSDARTNALDGLLARVARLGHSSSFVAVAVAHRPSTEQGRLSASPPDPEEDGDPQSTTTLVQDQRGEVGIRVATAGQMELLERAFASHQGTGPRTLPAEIVTYGPARSAPVDPPSSVFADAWIVVEPTDRQFTVRDTLALTRTLRRALMARSPIQPVPEVISGHLPRSGGERTVPTERAHLAVAALPFVQHHHADGSVKALAMLLPGSANTEERTTVLQAVGHWLDPDGGSGKLRLGRDGTATFRRSMVEDAPQSARPSRWMRPTRRWASVTPVALDRHPGDLTHADPAKRGAAEERARGLVRAACRYVDLPEPREVLVGFDPPVSGTRKARAFPPYAVQNGKLKRTLVHVTLTFDEPVRGPVLIGAGRYLGYGLCAPLPDTKNPGGDR